MSLGDYWTPTANFTMWNAVGLDIRGYGSRSWYHNIFFYHPLHVPLVRLVMFSQICKDRVTPSSLLIPCLLAPLKLSSCEPILLRLRAMLFAFVCSTLMFTIPLLLASNLLCKILINYNEFHTIPRCIIIETFTIQ